MAGGSAAGDSLSVLGKPVRFASITDEANAGPSEEFLSSIPRDFARQHLLLSAGRNGEVEQLLITQRSSPAAIWNVGVRLGVDIATSLVDPESLARRIDDAYAASAGHAHQSKVADEQNTAPADLDSLLAEADRDLLSTEGKGPIVKLVDALLFEAQGQRASDLHIQPLADRTLVRYRVDGVLHVARELPPSITQAVTSRVKVMGRMDIAERRMAQDGRATVKIGAGDSARSIDLRISTLPTSYGERVVLRLLDTDRGLRLARLDQIGMPSSVRTAYELATSRANGIVLLTGPTGSGKTTTLYATLRWLAARGLAGGELNVMTIEDPIEYELSTTGVAISQAQVNTKKGVTFATGLRHILRQDPDVVMVGEIRDSETARTAIQASLTGHLVFSTLHTNDAASAVTRLVDLGVEPYLVGSSLTAVLAQRLVRLIHAECSGNGCAGCLESGFRGRTGLFELLTLDDHMRALVTSGALASDLRRAAKQRGMRSLHNEGERLVDEHITSRLEVERVTTDFETNLVGGSQL